MPKNVALSAYKAGERSRKKGRHHKPKFTLPIAVIAGFTPLAIDMKEAIGAKGFVYGSAQAVSANTIGYFPDRKAWEPMYALKNFWGPVLLGTVVHKIANKLGVNRAIARAGIPIVRI